MSGKRGARWDWAAVQPCGTRAAYKRHKRRGERACESCLQANTRAVQDWRAQRKAAP